MSFPSWRHTRLGEIVTPEHGLQTGPFGSQLHASDYVSEGVPVVMPRDLAGNSISETIKSRVTPETATRLDRYRLLPGDIVFARRGQIGRCALVTRAQEGWLCGTGCLRARPASTTSPEFLIQLLQWPATVAWMQENAVGQTMRNLNTEILSAMPLRMPPLAAQKRIAEILLSVDACIDANRQVIEQTAVVKEGFGRRLLSHGLTRPASETNNGDHDMPDGWRIRHIGELCSFANGHGFKAREWSDQGLPIIRIQNLNGSREFKYFAGSAKERWLVEAGDLLFAWAGVRGTSFGPYIWDGPRGVLNQHIYRVRPKQKVAKLWLFETLRQVTREIEERAQGFKASLLHVRKSDITSHPVPVPPYSEQQAIAQRLASVSEMETIEISNLDAVTRLKRALMDDVFRGRVDVPA